MSEFIVVGPRRVCGAEPGETITVEDEGHAAYLAAAGHIERKQTPPMPAEGDKGSE